MINMMHYVIMLKENTKIIKAKDDKSYFMKRIVYTYMAIPPIKGVGWTFLVLFAFTMSLQMNLHKIQAKYLNWISIYIN